MQGLLGGVVPAVPKAVLKSTPSYRAAANGYKLIEKRNRGWTVDNALDNMFNAAMEVARLTDKQITPEWEELLLVLKELERHKRAHHDNCQDCSSLFARLKVVNVPGLQKEFDEMKPRIDVAEREVWIESFCPLDL